MTRRLTAWKLTSPWLRVPKGATKVRMIFSGRWKLQVPKNTGEDASAPAEVVEDGDA